MPARRQEIRAPVRRSSRRAILEDHDDEQASEAEDETTTSATHAHVPEHAVAPLTTPTNDNDTIMQEQEDVATQPEETIPLSREERHNPPPAMTRAPVERLASILSPTNSPFPAQSQPHTAPHPGSRPTSLKFKPKPAARRSKEEREAVEQAEIERLAARYAAESGRGRGDRGRGDRGRGMSGYSARGRDGALTQGYGASRGQTSFSRRDRVDPRVASGPLGGVTVGKKKSRGQGRGSGVEIAEDDGNGGEVDDAEDVAVAGSKGKAKRRETVKKEKGSKAENTNKEGEEDAVVNPSGKSSKGGKRKRDAPFSGTGARGKGKGRTKVKEEDEHPTYISSEGEFDSDTAAKINIEAINLISSGDEIDDDNDVDLPDLSEVARGKQKEASKPSEGKKFRSWMNRPVHVERLEHVERAMGVNTDASSLLSADLRRKARERKEKEGSLFVDQIDVDLDGRARRGRRKPKDVEFVRDERKWKGVYVDDDDDQQEEQVKVKNEPEDEVAAIEAPRALEEEDEVPGADTMEVDDIDVNAAVEDSAAAAGTHDDLEGTRPLVNETAAKEKVSSDEQDTSDDEESINEADWALPDDYDDRFEIEGYEDDTELIDHDEGDLDPHVFSEHQQEWGALLQKYNDSKVDDQKTASDRDPPPNVTFPANNDKARPFRRHKTYLIQLPPLVPSLHDSTAKAVTIKKEKKPPRTESISVHPDFPPTPSSKDHLKEESTPPPADTNHQKIPNAIHQPIRPSDFSGGVAGSLKFYSSGRTVASWGGMDFEVSGEKEVLGLAQETVMMEYEKVVTKLEEQDKWEDVVTVGGHSQGEGGKSAYSGGKVGGGFCMLGA